ncbi:hypothetical protein [Streptomyces spongiae]|uniref:Tat pathway signal sequence domain protein n=1 Tax=Streptomyces spongiae TaxID=565072 RepID=A0A5N8X8Z6_9ACTN|nr:hypothetical protein [Streptomyces spongiae]MPY55902.1 hypothetical protein [Streptomyces spongiae]
MTPPTTSCDTAPKTGKVRRAALAVLVGAGLIVAATPADAAPNGGYAHRTVTAADGQTFHLRLAAGPVVLPSSGGTVRVAGTGYNRAQGIFLAFCVIPKGVKVGDPSTYTTRPTPCLGGTHPTTPVSRRITDADTGGGAPGLTLPYQEGGSFVTTLENVRPEIADGVVCGRTVDCAVVTRADYTATDNRLYDQYIPVRFTS